MTLETRRAERFSLRFAGTAGSLLGNERRAYVEIDEANMTVRYGPGS